jgi:hypothetical protein
MISNLVLKNIPTKTSADSVWLGWYKELKKSIGRKNANSIFLKAWQTRGSSAANTHMLREELSSSGLTLATDNALSDIRDFAGGVGDFFEGVLNIGKYAGIAILVIVIGGAAMIVYNVGKKPIESAKALGNLRTGGLKK